MKIKSYWQFEKGNWDNNNSQYTQISLSDIKEKVLELTLDCRDKRPSVRFIGGPTGFESYCFDSLLNNLPISTCCSEEDIFVICGGTINSWARCWVTTKDFYAILNVFKDSIKETSQWTHLHTRMEEDKEGTSGDTKEDFTFDDG